MSVLALIPARGGSKGIPGKNIMEILGRPMIAYSIRQAHQSEEIDRVVVSTDHEETAEIAAEWGAEVPFLRPAEYARDDSPDLDVFRHALEWLRDEEGYEPEAVVHLRPPGPARRVSVIDQAVRLLRSDPHADAVRSIEVASQTPFKMWFMGSDGYLTPALTREGEPDSQSVPRQSLPLAYWQNGYVDVIRPRAVLEAGSMWGRRVLPLEVEAHVELDYPEDIPRVEEALRRLEEGDVAAEPVFRKADRLPT